MEILDRVCKDYEVTFSFNVECFVSNSEIIRSPLFHFLLLKCHTLLEENEEHIERWWFKL